MKRTPLTRHTPLARSGRLAPRSARPARQAQSKLDRLWQGWIAGGQPCSKCGTRQHVSGHHLIPRRHLRYRHDPDNGIPLCHRPDGCHDWAHDNPKEFDEWLKQAHPKRWEWLARMRLLVNQAPEGRTL